ncbi:hypothetical protein M413DRAFT_55263, partial [Hebeloma cylindrosporum]
LPPPPRRSPMAKTSSPSSGARRKKKTNPPAATFDELRQSQKSVKAQHLKASGTTKKYAEMVAAGQEWHSMQVAAALASISPDGLGMNHECPDDRNDPNNLYLQPEFACALDHIPNHFSPTALTMYITYKCIHQNLKSGTGDSIHAAFKHMWDQASGGLYRGKWCFNEAKQLWEGNPIESAEVADLTKALRNKGGAQGGDRTHSVTMSKQHMEKIFAWSERICPSGSAPASNLEERKLKMKHLGFHGFSSSAWTVWSRCFELVKLQKKKLTMDQENPSAFGLMYHALQLIDRKGWQGKMGEQELDLLSNIFHLYDRPDLGACNAYRWLNEWISFLEDEIYKRPLDPDDYIFPAMGVNGIVHPRELMSHETVQKYIDEFTYSAGIAQATAGRFSTHCFRRGGAQYYFMFAPVGKRWSLRKVRWWGGWAEGEQGETLIRYLLDELHSYEESFNDALCPLQVEKDVTFMAEHHAVAPINNETAGIIHSQLVGQMRSIHNEIRITQHQMQLQLQASLSKLNITSESLNFTGFLAQSHDHRPLPFPSGACRTHAIHPIMAPTRCPSQTQPLGTNFSDPRPRQGSQSRFNPVSRPLPTHAMVIPDIPVKNADGTRPHVRDSWRCIVDHWKNGDPERGLTVPLKEWPDEWLRGPNRRLVASKYNQRARIAQEFLTQYDGDEVKFLAAYPEAEEGHTRLLTAIQVARKAQGDFAPRVR